MKLKELFKFILVFLVVLQSGTILFYGASLAFLLPLVLYSAIQTISQGKVVTNNLFILIMIMVVLQIIEYLLFEVSVNALLVSFFSYLTLVFIVIIVDKSFISVLINLVLAISVISLIMWGSLNLFPPLSGKFQTLAESLPRYSGQTEFFKNQGGDARMVHIWLYNINKNNDDLYRNCGIFYEPGRFAFFLILALIYCIYHKWYSLRNWRVIVLIGTLVTTFSTSGYLALLILFSFYFINFNKGIFKRLFIILVSLTTAYLVYNLDFIGDKISEQISSDSSDSRFSAIAYHLSFVEDHLMFGYGTSMPSLDLSPNGLSFFLLKHGILAFFAVGILLYQHFSCFLNNVVNSNQILVTSFFSLIAVLFSQTISCDPIFYFLIFMPILLKKINRVLI